MILNLQNQGEISKKLCWVLIQNWLDTSHTVSETFTNLALCEAKQGQVETPRSPITWGRWFRKDAAVVLLDAKEGSRGDGQWRSQEVLQLWGVQRICQWNVRLRQKPHEKWGVEVKHLGLTQEATHQRLTLHWSRFLPYNYTRKGTRQDRRWFFQKKRTLGSQLVSGKQKDE